MPITTFLEQNCKNFGNDICLVEINPEQKETNHVSWKEYELIEPTPASTYRREISWNVFDEKSNRVANLLLSCGVTKGKKIGLLMMNCIEWLPIYFGILKTGAVVVPLNFRYAADEIEYCMRLADIEILFFGPEFVSRLAEIADAISAGNERLLLYVGPGECPDFADNANELAMNCKSSAPGIALDDADDAAIYFSSGTTGFPKAILHNHASLVHACLTEQNHHQQTKDDVFLCIPPLYHTGAKMHWFGSFLVGAKAILLKGTRPEYILKAVSEEQCTIVWLLVPWAQDLLLALDSGQLKIEDYQLDQWRLMHIGAQPVPKSLIRRWQTYFPTHAYDTNYGLSESIGPGCVHLGVDNIEKIGAIGKAGFGWQTKIVDESAALVKPGEVGELCVRGPGLMTCYYKDPAATAEVLKDGWLFTGDMAMEDEDGFIFLVDRKKDVIISGGENLYPVQIENFLSSHQAVKDVAVIGLPDSRLGEIAAAIVEIKEGHSCQQQDLEDFCKELPKYKRPRTYIFAQVPRNPTGKIEKTVLRQRYGGECLVDAQNKA